MFIRLLTRARLRTMTLCLATAVGGAVLLWRPEAVAAGISRGLSVCGSVIIPTLLPFLVLAGFVSRSGLAGTIGRFAERPTRLLFGLPGCCAAGILLAFIGGYPAGSTAVGELVRSGRITREDGRRMLRFCVCAGPGFLINTVGVGMLHSSAFGVRLFAAHLLAALILGISGASRADRQPRRTPPVPLRRHSPTEAFVGAVTAACQSLLTMCGFLVLFSAVLSLLDSFAATGRLSGAFLACLLEVSCGCLAASGLRALAPLLIGFAVGFGGLSVHCQIAASLFDTDLLTPSFWLARVAHGALTALLTVLLCRFFPITLPVLGGGSAPLVQVFSGSVAVSVFLLILCGIWLLCVDKDRPVTYNEAKA